MFTRLHCQTDGDALIFRVVMHLHDRVTIRFCFNTPYRATKKGKPNLRNFIAL